MQHFLQFSEFNVFKGFHYSENLLKIGSIIHSNIDVSTIEYEKIWSVYKEVANKLGVYYPKKYGYAYPIEKKHLNMKHEYIVEAPFSQVTKCDYRYSIQILMENSFFSPMSLEYALNPKNHNALLKHAFDYFSPHSLEHVEYISDNFVVKKIVS